MHLENVEERENSADPDQTAPKQHSDLDLHCSVFIHICLFQYLEFITIFKIRRSPGFEINSSK